MKVIITLLLAFSVSMVYAQKAEKEVEKVIHGIFDGMRDGDTTRVASHFLPGATLKSLYYKDGKSMMQEGSIQGWLNSIAGHTGGSLDERLWNVEVRVDENLAQVWTYYALFVNGVYHHCGVDAFQLFKDGENWKVFHIADTRRKECNIPDIIMK